eukprot:1822-Heterococcus_DN1.PRE.1
MCVTAPASSSAVTAVLNTCIAFMWPQPSASSSQKRSSSSAGGSSTSSTAACLTKFCTLTHCRATVQKGSMLLAVALSLASH